MVFKGRTLIQHKLTMLRSFISCVRPVSSFRLISKQYHWIMTERPSCAEKELLSEKRGQVQHVILNRPSSLNAVNLSMVRGLTSRLKEWLDDPGVSVITVRGAGDKAFCAGGDLKALTFSAREGGNYGQLFFYEEFTMNYIIGTYPKPLISILNGITFGGAAGLTVIGRFCVATDKTVFCMPECAIGLFPDVGSGHYMPRLPGNMGFFLGLTGYRLKGRDIATVGLASHYINCSKIPELEACLEALPAPANMDDIQALLDDFQKQSEPGVPERFSLEPHEEEIARCFGGNCVEEIVCNLQKEGTEWAQQQLSALKKMSPTSLKITYRLLKEGVNKSLAETLQTEYRLTQRCLADHDFHEGIRAVILEKDGAPKWNPATLEEVSDARVDYYFSPFDKREQELIVTDSFSW